MNRCLLAFALLSISILLPNCSENSMTADPVEEPEPDPEVIPSGTSEIKSSVQRPGDAQAGFDYLVNGDYLSSGVPYDAFTIAYGTDDRNLLNRSGDNAIIPYEFTAVDAPNGVRVVAPNCLQCHGGTINGQFIVGLGNTVFDFTIDQSTIIPVVDAGLIALYGLGSPEWEAYEPFQKASLATGPLLVMESRGANPANKIAAALSAHRDRETLIWKDEPAVTIPEEVIPSDVPPWWVLKKKHAMFYPGIGRGDFSKYLMASSLLTMTDSTKATEVNEHFPDVLAFINSIEPPAYPMSIDQDLAEKGQMIFELNCSACHGTYGPEESYPNLLVSLDRVGTDPALSNAYSNSDFDYYVDWFNTGWFSKDPNRAELVTEGGYVAQPLDGIWASAPYLHNGSVPTLDDLLNSSQRPTYWKRTFEDDDYDFAKVGWNYTTPDSKEDGDTYDATLRGYGNQGHTFGDALSAEDRTALIEYLKTL